MKLFFATSNKNKVLEASKLLEPLGIKPDQLRLPYPEIQADTLEEVARFGLKFLKKNRPLILEDAGLFIDSLSGFPGVYSAYVFKTIGNEGILRLLEGKKRNAIFRSVIGLIERGGKISLFPGVCRGMIAEEARGECGFGYDPLFIPEGSKKRFAEMETEEKNRFSHRGKSFKRFYDYFQLQIESGLQPM